MPGFAATAVQGVQKGGDKVKYYVWKGAGCALMGIKESIQYQLSQYLSKSILKEELYHWAVDKLYEADETPLKIDYLEIREILVDFAGIDDADDSYCDELADRDIKILSGEECGAFAFMMRIPESSAGNELLQIKDILQKYLVKKQMSKSEMLVLEEFVQKESHTFDTVKDMMESQIIDLLKLGYEFYVEEENIVFEVKSILFPCENMDEPSWVLEDSLLKRVIALIECYEGKRYFFVHVSFRDGIGNISLQVS